MTIDYAQLLSDEQKRSILEQRIQQFAAEGFQHQINRQLAEATGNQTGVQQSDEALVIIGAAITLHQEELQKLTESTSLVS